MSITLRTTRQTSLPASDSEIHSSRGSLGSDLECEPTTNVDLPGSMAISSPVEDFRRSLQNEKHIRRHVKRQETLPLPRTLRNEKTMEALEKNYKLQIQTLLEEVNQLKLDKKIMEKKMERSYKEIDSPSKGRSTIFNDPTIDEGIVKKMLESKNSTIKELEFQVSQLKRDNSTLKLRLDTQTRQMEELCRRIADSETLKEVLDEKNEEISRLHESLEAEGKKHDKIIQEISVLRNENIALKLKTLCPTCGLATNTTGTNSFTGPHCNCVSKDQSFFSSIDKHKSTTSDAKFISKILNFSEINDDQRLTTGYSPVYSTTKHYKTSMGMYSGFFSAAREIIQEDAHAKTKSDTSQRQALSVKVLSDYEEGLKKEKKSQIQKDPKTLDRIIEVNKIKSYVIEAQNKKLLSILKAGNEDKVRNVDITNP